MTVSGPDAPERRRGIVCVGRLYCDLVFSGVPRFPTPGTEVFAAGLGLHAGGGAFLTAAYAAALGRPASLAAVWPGSPFGAVVAADVAAAGVDVSLSVPAAEANDPQITVVIGGQQDRAFLTRRSGPAAPALTVAQLERLGAAHLHIGELTTLAEQPELVPLARAAGLTVSLDCSWDDDLGVAEAALIADVDIFLPNEAEAARIAALGVAAAPLTVVKCGAAGARAHRAGQEWSVGADPVERVVDATGAGDAFNGGFLDAWLSGAGIEASLRAGGRCGAAAVQAPGGTGGLKHLSSFR